MNGGRSMLMFVDTAGIAYTNMTDNFKGMSHTADDDIEMYFTSATGADSFDKILLSCKDEKQVEAMKGLAGALAGSATKPFTVIADDVNSVYAEPNIIAIESITLAAKGGQRAVEAITNASAVTRTLTVAESGTLFTVDMSTVDTAVAITLPLATTAGTAGVEYDFCFLVNSDDGSDFVLTTGANAVDIFGTIDCLAAVSTNQVFNGLSKITVDASVSSVESIEGMRFNLLCDGANWHITGHIETALAVTHLVGSATA